MTVNEGVPGIGDPGRLIGWLAANGVPGAGGLRRIELIAGGRSNLTYRLDFAAAQPGDPRRLVLRRPPLGHVLPTAHDMSREFRVLSALSGTRVPVPAPVALCLDEDVIGAPFYVMRYVDGLILRTQEDGEKITSEQAGQVSECLAETLAAIHQVDVDAVGLPGFGKPDGYLARQLKRWQRQWDLSATRELPEFTRLVARLAQRLPETAEGTLVHGDFRLDNLLITLAPRPRVAAVVDWEMSTLGDPLADLGLALSYWTDPGDTSSSPWCSRAFTRGSCSTRPWVRDLIRRAAACPCSSGALTGCSTTWADGVLSGRGDRVREHAQIPGTEEEYEARRPAPAGPHSKDARLRGAVHISGRCF